MVESLCEMQIVNFSPIILDAILCSILKRYVLQTFRDCKMGDFIALEHGCIIVANYEAKFHDLSRYDTQLVSTKEHRICLFIKGIEL